jgi:hypothetical protein
MLPEPIQERMLSLAAEIAGSSNVVAGISAWFCRCSGVGREGRKTTAVRLESQEALGRESGEETAHVALRVAKTPGVLVGFEDDLWLVPS